MQQQSTTKREKNKYIHFKINNSYILLNIWKNSHLVMKEKYSHLAANGRALGCVELPGRS